MSTEKNSLFRVLSSLEKRKSEDETALRVHAIMDGRERKREFMSVQNSRLLVGGVTLRLAWWRER